jgi:hypothetical protein
MNRLSDREDLSDNEFTDSSGEKYKRVSILSSGDDDTPSCSLFRTRSQFLDELNDVTQEIEDSDDAAEADTDIEVTFISCIKM